MILKKLPTEIQSLLNASSKILNYKNAVEELVYNSLDADATSVAVRIHIYENVIQVIDNGFGIAKCDIPLLGERYTSSKVNDKSSFKSAPIKFRFRGESLSNIIEVSECVKITTRHKDSDETWVKIFYKGHHKDSQVTSMRPSKGTTVEIKGFLYNLHIQKKATNPLNQLQNIKLLLQQLSLVNTNVSISLRDNSKNEILFKLHKNRDVYQTLSSVYEIDKKDLQELQIEKHQYKAKGFISRQNSNISPYQWIYLNGRFLNKCPLHDIIYNSFTKNKQLCRNMKTKNNFLDFEKKLQNNDIPSYFIFITCPHLDYDINRDSTKTITEFKDWKQIRELLEKLVQFYKGDIKLQKLEVSQTKRKNKIQDTREEVRKIIEKVLGNKTKGHEISQFRKGVKGKIVKKKKNPNSSSIKRFKNMHKTGKKSKVTDHNPKENLSSVIEAPISLNFPVSSKNSKNENNLVKRFIKSIKVKERSKPKLKIGPIIQQNKNEKTVYTHTNYQEIADPCYLNFKEFTSSIIEDTAKCNNSYIARNKKTSIKGKSFKRKKEKKKIDPIMKQYMQETALEMYNEKVKKKEIRINEVKDKNPYVFDTKGDASLLQNRNDIHTFYEHKLAFNAVTPLNRVGKDYLKSSDLLKTILNSEKAYSEENIVQFKKPFKNKHEFYEKRTIHKKNCIQSIERRNNDVVNDKVYRNNDLLLDIDYSSYRRKQTDNLRNIQNYFENKCSDIEKDMIHVQHECELTSNLDQYDRHHRITHVNGIENNMSTTHIYKSFPKLTFESHKYNLNDTMMRNNNKPKRFISKQSKENVNVHNNIQPTNVTSKRYQSHFNQHYNSKNKRKQSYKNPYLEPIKKVPYFEHKSSHTIEFSANNMYNANKNTNLEQWKYKITGNVQNTYTIIDSNISLDIENYLNNLNKNAKLNQESVASYLKYNLSTAKLIEKETHQDPTIIQNLEENNLEVNILNSEMPAFNFTQKSVKEIEPIDLCEAVYHDNEVNNLNMDKDKTIQDKINYLVNGNKTGHDTIDSSSYKNDILSRYFQSIENIQNLPLNDYSNLSYRKQKGKKINRLEENQNDNCPIVDIAEKSPNVIIEGISSNFQTVQKDQTQMGKSKNLFSSEEYSKERRNVESQRIGDSNLVANNTRIVNGSNAIEVTNNNVIHDNQNMDIENLNKCVTDKPSKDDEKIIIIEDNQIKSNELEIVEEIKERMPNAGNEIRKTTENFKLQRRHSFVPKGMSPIFENCNSKNICSYNLETDYFQDDLYNNFANDVLDNIKIYENKVSNAIEVPIKINKDSCLKFNTQSLKDAKVFGQVDRKFIIAELKSENLNMKHLVLFDQHAVHERITLEENLSDYKDVDQWNSLNCETLLLKLSKDDVLYLNNFRDKFKQFGLEWKTESDSQITVNAAPKAIFGKYCRQADVIIQSIKNLILEEINAIKCQGGNTLLYPKAIMNLVFSEACRYAIKFGDKLSKRECATLISSLSSCKTPFQCAHGRPVLAVLADFTTYDYEYKVDTSKILKFRNKMT